jgi:hypothetical protein
MVAFEEIWDWDWTTSHSGIRFDKAKNEKRICLAFGILRG